MTTMDELVAKMGAENRAEEKKRRAPKAAEVAETAAFLKGWAKGKPIRRESADSTFWAAGKYMTKIDSKMADALVKGGNATITGKATDAGATLTML